MIFFQVRGVRQQERVRDYCVSMKQNLHCLAIETRGLEYVAKKNNFITKLIGQFFLPQN